MTAEVVETPLHYVTIKSNREVLNLVHFLLHLQWCGTSAVDKTINTLTELQFCLYTHRFIQKLFP